jgi:L-ascorbate metabolism protein UlaG (beta-lactamase superfamily)
MKLTYFGHSCFLVEIAGMRLLFDPFITPNPLAAGVDTASIEADTILISHGHADHVADAVALAGQTGATVLANWEIAEWLGKQGVSDVKPMNHGGSAALSGGRAKMVHAIHSSSLPDGTFGGNPAGFVIETSSGSFYYAGDTALTLDMKLVGEEFDLDFAVLPIGDTFTMGADDAVKAAKLCGAKTVVGVHYNTFPPIQIDTDAAKAVFEGHEVLLLLPEIGGTIDLT